MDDVCPYCGNARADSDDHIFPQFLGGRATIRVCRTCNSRFGHDFEAKVSADIAPLVVGLAKCGLKSARRVVWRRAFKDPNTGLDYDLDSNGNVSLASPLIERDQEGRIRHITFKDLKTAKKHGPSLLRKGLAKEIRYRSQTVTFKEPPFNTFSFEIGPEIRRLALKMCAGVARHTEVKLSVLDRGALAYLMNEQFRYVDYVAPKMVFQTYDALDSQRPPLSHVVFVEGNNREGKVYGVVQFYGSIQLYLALNSSYLGPSFSVMGILDPQSTQERFEIVEPLNLPEAPLRGSVQEYQEGVINWLGKVDSQVHAVFGRNVLRLKPQST